MSDIIKSDNNFSSIISIIEAAKQRAIKASMPSLSICIGKLVNIWPLL